MNNKLISKVMAHWKKGKNVWEISQITETPEPVVMDIVQGRIRPSRKGVKITSHKGGRTERFECRLTPAEKQIVMERVKSSGLSAADWLMAQAQPTMGAADVRHAPEDREGSE